MKENTNQKTRNQTLKCEKLNLRKYTWEKIALADLYGAGLGAGLAISNPVVGPSAIVISGTAMSAVGPLFM